MAEIAEKLALEAAEKAAAEAAERAAAKAAEEAAAKAAERAAAKAAEEAATKAAEEAAERAAQKAAEKAAAEAAEKAAQEAAEKAAREAAEKAADKAAQEAAEKAAQEAAEKAAEKAAAEAAEKAAQEEAEKAAERAAEKTAEREAAEAAERAAEKEAEEAAEKMASKQAEHEAAQLSRQEVERTVAKTAREGAENAGSRTWKQSAKLWGGRLVNLGNALMMGYMAYDFVKTIVEGAPPLPDEKLLTIFLTATLKTNKKISKEKGTPMPTGVCVFVDSDGLFDCSGVEGAIVSDVKPDAVQGKKNFKMLIGGIGVLKNNGIVSNATWQYAGPMCQLDPANSSHLLLGAHSDPNSGTVTPPPPAPPLPPPTKADVHSLLHTAIAAMQKAGTTVHAACVATAEAHIDSSDLEGSVQFVLQGATAYINGTGTLTNNGSLDAWAYSGSEVKAGAQPNVITFIDNKPKPKPSPPKPHQISLDILLKSAVSSMEKNKIAVNGACIARPEAKLDASKLAGTINFALNGDAQVYINGVGTLTNNGSLKSWAFSGPGVTADHNVLTFAEKS